jgi:GcrA cell cycle regulator
MSWTDERVELLRKLWSQGLSASQIAAELGHGITRNAVIGKVHRLGLSGRAKTPTTPSSRPRKITRAPSHPLTHSGSRTSAAAFSSGGGGGGAVRGNLALSAQAATMLSPVIDFDVQPFEDVVVPMSERISIMELRETTCRWPFGDPTSADFRFCGGNSPVGEPYCSFHARIAYQPSNDRRRAKPRV